MESLVNGVAMVLEYGKQPAFTYTMKNGKRSIETKNTDSPKMLVSIGSGVSIIKVNDFNSF